MSNSTCCIDVKSQRRSGGIGLESLGEDQFDGLARLSRTIKAREDAAGRAFERPPSDIRVAGLTLRLASSPKESSSPQGKPQDAPKGRDVPPSSRNTFTAARSAARYQKPMNDAKHQSPQPGEPQALKNWSDTPWRNNRRGPDRSRASSAPRSQPTRNRTAQPDLGASSPRITARILAPTHEVKPPAPPTLNVKPRIPAPSKDVQAVVSNQSPGIQTTDIPALFEFPATPSQQLVTAKLPAAVTSRLQHHLERYAGDYSRYLPERLTREVDVGRVGPVGYAELHLARRYDVTVRQRSNAVAIVNKAAGSGIVQSASVGA